MRTFTLILVAGALAGASGCSLVIDSSTYTGTSKQCDASICLDVDGSGNVQQELLDVKDQRVSNWCSCFKGVWPYMDDQTQCEQALSTGATYESCMLDAYSMNQSIAAPVLSCLLNAEQTALACEQAAGCAVGAFAACQDQLDTAYHGGCPPDNEAQYNQTYFSASASCAKLNVIGTPLDNCGAGAPLDFATVVGDTIQSGDDYDLVDSPCFPTDGNGDPTNMGAGDQVVQWTSPHDTEVIIDSFGSSFDTILYQVADCMDTTDSLQCNDDAAGRFQSRIRATATAGTPLTLVLDGYAAPDFGTARINFTTLWCVDSATMTIPSAATPMAFSGTLTVANGDDLKPSAMGCVDPSTLSGDNPDFEAAWEAPAAGTYTIDTRGSTFDTVLYVRHSCDDDGDPSLNDLDCNDDISDTNQQSEVAVSLVAGETVIIVVDSNNPLELGNFVINITPN